MIIKEVKGITHYQFSNGDKLGTNIFVFEANGEAIMFDSGYEEHYLQVRKHLEDKGVELKKVILTHFHPDHIGVLTQRDGVEVIGSYRAKETLNIFFDDYEKYLPDVSIEEETVLEFHGEEFILTPNPSHSVCTLIIETSAHIFVGDDVMFFDDKTQSLPYIAEDFETHLLGTKLLRKKAEGKMVMPSHGPTTKCTMFIYYVIRYLDHMMKFPKHSYKQFSNLYKIDFGNAHFHEMNVEKL